MIMKTTLHNCKHRQNRKNDFRITHGSLSPALQAVRRKVRRLIIDACPLWPDNATNCNTRSDHYINAAQEVTLRGNYEL